MLISFAKPDHLHESFPRRMALLQASDGPTLKQIKQNLVFISSYVKCSDHFVDHVYIFFAQNLVLNLDKCLNNRYINRFGLSMRVKTKIVIALK